MKKYIQNEKGLTLVEILAALVILSIVLISFSSFFIQSAKNAKYNKEKLTAVNVAEEVVADVRSGEYMQIAIGNTFEESNYIGYKVSIEIKEGPIGTNLNKAIVTVKSDSTTGIKKQSFTTEMYFKK